MIDQGYIDVAITSACFGVGIAILGWWESGRDRRLERKLWKRYLKESKVCPTQIQDWEKFRADRITAHG